jgi:hypothetical protein
MVDVGVGLHKAVFAAFFVPEKNKKFETNAG